MLCAAVGTYSDPSGFLAIRRTYVRLQYRRGQSVINGSVRAWGLRNVWCFDWAHGRRAVFDTAEREEAPLGAQAVEVVPQPARIIILWRMRVPLPARGTTLRTATLQAGSVPQ